MKSLKNQKKLKSVSGKKRKLGERILLSIRNNWQLYAMSIPAVVLLFCFAYLPMGGLIIAFKKYNFRLGIWGSPFMDPWYKNFEILFKNNAVALNAIKNTIILNALFISVGTVFALALALCFNEISNKYIKKITQSITFLPYFISTVVIGIFVSGLLGFENGVINRIIVSLGGEKVAFYMEAKWWPWILLIVNIWKGAGYNAVVYLATISGIDSSYYEAAKIDGASRWQQTRYISLPLLKPTVITMTLLSVGKIMNSDFGLFYNVTGDMPTLYETADVIDTYIYRALRQLGDIGISSATGFFQSIVGFFLVLLSNWAANKYSEEGALF
ncbi:MAG: sugar ABC transporter permease [Lachnospiraceae bacterium]|nr:sugar ABC transporter permease [Lachnospiraceae bacterium]